MSCCDQAELLPYDRAINELLSVAQPITESERVPVADARSRVMAEDVISTIDVPPADNSAMDGYALRFSDLARVAQQSPGRVVLPVSQRIPAGATPRPLQAGSAARIFTGSGIPSGADTVVMQERCKLLEDVNNNNFEAAPLVELPADVEQGDNIRKKGLDITEGSVILKRGRRLLPQDLGLQFQPLHPGRIDRCDGHGEDRSGYRSR